MNPAHAMDQEGAAFDERWDLELIEFDSQEVTEIDDLLNFDTDVTEPLVVSEKSPTGTPNHRPRTCFGFLFRIL